MKLSIKNKVLLYIFLSCFIIIFIYGFVLYLTIKNNIEKEIEKRLNIAGKIIIDNIDSDDIKYFLLKGKVYENYYYKLSRLKDILELNDIFIINREKKVIFSLKDENEKFYLDIDDFEIKMAFSGRMISSPSYIGAFGRYFKNGYIKLNNDYVLGIEINILYENYLKNYLKLFLTISVFILGLALFISFLISSGITKSIIKLKEKAEKIAQREFEENIEIKSNEEEIIVLKDTIDKMKAELKDYIENKEKMANIGEFAAGIAHEMRNSLNVLSGYSELILEKTEDEKIKKYAVEINKNIFKFSEFLNNFLMYTKNFVPEYRKVDIKDILKKVIDEVFKNKKEVKVEINYDINENYERQADEYLLKKAFYNLIFNAYEAVLETEKKEIKISIAKEKNDKIIIKIKDSGKGIKEDIKNKIFQPFVSGKKSGVGLGLSISYKIIKELHSGEILVNSKENEGTEFIIII